MSTGKIPTPAAHDAPRRYNELSVLPTIAHYLRRKKKPTGYKCPCRVSSARLSWPALVLPWCWPVPPRRLASARCRSGGIPRRVRRERLLAPSWSRCRRSSCLEGASASGRNKRCATFPLAQHHHLVPALIHSAVLVSDGRTGGRPEQRHRWHYPGRVFTWQRVDHDDGVRRPGIECGACHSLADAAPIARSRHQT